jgi:N-acetylneuraminic acid mutarotase
VIEGKLYIWGGYGPGFDPTRPKAAGPLADGAVYDPARNSWEKLPDAPVKFGEVGYGMVWAVWRDRFVLFGGRKQRTGAIYDPGTRNWEKIAEAPFDVGVLSACAVNGDRLFLWSGYAEACKNGAVYDFVKKEWKRIPEAPIALRGLTYAQPVGNKVVVWGGWRPPKTFLRDGAVFDLDKETWERIPDLPGDVPFALHPGW